MPVVADTAMRMVMVITTSTKNPSPLAGEGGTRPKAGRVRGSAHSASYRDGAAIILPMLAPFASASPLTFPCCAWAPSSHLR